MTDFDEQAEACRFLMDRGRNPDFYWMERNDLARLLHRAREAAVRETEEACAKEVCIYCSGEKPAWDADKEQWSHKTEDGTTYAWCTASAIHERRRREGK